MHQIENELPAEVIEAAHFVGAEARGGWTGTGDGVAFRDPISVGELTDTQNLGIGPTLVATSGPHSPFASPMTLSSIPAFCYRA